MPLSPELEQLARTVLQRLSEASRADMNAIVRAALDRAAALERDRCIRVCRDREDLWRRTIAASSPLPEARGEARARANEAAYLADLLATGAGVDDELTN